VVELLRTEVEACEGIVEEALVGGIVTEFENAEALLRSAGSTPRIPTFPLAKLDRILQALPAPRPPEFGVDTPSAVILKVHSAAQHFCARLALRVSPNFTATIAVNL
jgi:hypothetical protein